MTPAELQEQKDLELYKDGLTKSLDLFEDDLSRKLERFKDARAAEGEYLKTLSTIATDSWEKSRDGTKQLILSASAIATLYSGVVGVVFAVKDNPLPQRGVWAIIFLAMAVFFAAVYLAPISSTGLAVPINNSLADDATLPQLVKLPRNVTQITNSLIARNRWYVRAAAISLGLGAAFTMLPFFGTAPEAQLPTPTPPPLPAAPLTGAAEQAYKWQVELYRIALCKNPETAGVVAPCIERLNGDVVPNPSGFARPQTAEVVESTPDIDKGWDADDWSLFAAIIGFVLVGSQFLLGRRGSPNAQHDQLTRLESDAVSADLVADEALTERNIMILAGMSRPTGSWQGRSLWRRDKDDDTDRKAAPHLLRDEVARLSLRVEQMESARRQENETATDGADDPKPPPEPK